MRYILGGLHHKTINRTTERSIVSVSGMPIDDEADVEHMSVLDINVGYNCCKTSIAFPQQICYTYAKADFL